MEIQKILNNNVVVTRNKMHQEMVVMGKGLAFQKRVGDTFDPVMVEKTFVLENRTTSDQLAQLLRDTSDQYLGIASRILDYARSKLPYELDEYLYVALTDHISFAVNRHRQGIDWSNPMLWEIKKYYKAEFKIAQKAIAMMNEEMGLSLKEDEAASIALHLVNSQMSGDNMAAVMQMTKMVNQILTIVKYHYKMELNEESVEYERFITHLRFFAMRYMRHEKPTEDTESSLYSKLTEEYRTAYECSKKVKTYLTKTFGWDMTKDEQIYLLLHIHRVAKRHQTLKTE